MFLKNYNKSTLFERSLPSRLFCCWKLLKLDCVNIFALGSPSKKMLEFGKFPKVLGGGRLSIKLPYLMQYQKCKKKITFSLSHVPHMLKIASIAHHLYHTPNRLTVLFICCTPHAKTSIIYRKYPTSSKPTVIFINHMSSYFTHV